MAIFSNQFEAVEARIASCPALDSGLTGKLGELVEFCLATPPDEACKGFIDTERTARRAHLEFAQLVVAPAALRG